MSFIVMGSYLLSVVLTLYVQIGGIFIVPDEIFLKKFSHGKSPAFQQDIKCCGIQLRFYHLNIMLPCIINRILCSPGSSIVICDHPAAMIAHPYIPLLENAVVIMVADIHNEIRPPEQVVILALPFVIPAPGEARPWGGGNQM